MFLVGRLPAPPFVTIALVAAFTLALSSGTANGVVTSTASAATCTALPVRLGVIRQDGDVLHLFPNGEMHVVAVDKTVE